MTHDWDEYRMDYQHPHLALEPIGIEIETVADVLDALAEDGFLAHTGYDPTKLLALRATAANKFDIPWTAITPRMQRLLYAINAIHQPQVMIAAGVFRGFTFICNAGAAVGPGACYEAAQLIGLEIDPEEAHRAEKNIRRIDSTGTARVIAADAVGYLDAFDAPIDLLYLDADGAGGRGKAIYLDLIEAAYDKLPEGALILAHNSFNAAGQLSDYFGVVRGTSRFAASLNIVLDPEGLEVTRR